MSAASKLGDSLKSSSTLYPLRGLEGLRYHFQVLRLAEHLPDDEFRPVTMERISLALWRNALKCPVVPTMRGGTPGFYVPEARLPVGQSNWEVDLGTSAYHVEATQDQVQFSIDEASGAERRLISLTLERAVTDQLLRERYWRDGWKTFYKQRPENEARDDELLAYRGFRFGIALLGDRHPHLAADLITKYVGRISLAAHSEEAKVASLQDHLEGPPQERARFLRDNGEAKFPCRFLEATGKRVDEFVVSEEVGTVFDYYRKRYPRIQLPADDEVVLVKDGPKREAAPVPASRLFPLFTTEYEGMRRTSVKPQLAPHDRARMLTPFLRALSGVSLGKVKFFVEEKPLDGARTVFRPPRLEFGNGRILSVETSSDERSFDLNAVLYASSKLRTLRQAHAFSTAPVPDVHLLYPQSLSRSARETLLERLRSEITKFTGQRPNVARQEAYDIGAREREGVDLLRRAKALNGAAHLQLALVVLWRGFSGRVYPSLKDTLSRVPSQCLTERVANDLTRGKDTGLALAVMTEAGLKPWVLADELHYDLHLGIDVLYGRVGYHLLYDRGGRRVMSEFGETRRRGQPKEALSRAELETRLKGFVHRVMDEGLPARGLLIHRDGRWQRSEEEALRAALTALIKDGVLPKDFRCAVVEIRKNHLPARLFTLDEAARPSLQNPLFGSYMQLDRDSVILATTGRPGKWRGRSAGTLLLRVAQRLNMTDVGEVAEDVYRLSHLNWNAPDVEINLPVTIRWTDDALRRTLRSDESDETEADQVDDVGEDGFVPAFESSPRR